MKASSVRFLMACLLLLCSNCHTCVRAMSSVRLRDTETKEISQASGRVELFLQREWRTMSIDGFDRFEGEMVCERLGYSKFVKWFRVGESIFEGKQPVLLSQLSCEDVGQSIFDCDSLFVTQSDQITDSIGVGVTCSDEEDTVVKNKVDQSRTIAWNKNNNATDDGNVDFDPMAFWIMLSATVLLMVVCGVIFHKRMQCYNKYYAEERAKEEEEEEKRRAEEEEEEKRREEERKIREAELQKQKEEEEIRRMEEAVRRVMGQSGNPELVQAVAQQVTTVQQVTAAQQFQDQPAVPAVPGDQPTQGAFAEPDHVKQAPDVIVQP